MLGIFIILIVSFAGLYLADKKFSDALGVLPFPHRLFQLIIGLLFIAMVFLFIIYLKSPVKSLEWKLNNPVNGKLILAAAWYHVKSALTEELVFRGALLYILIKKLGMQKALILSAIAFGVYHWFSFGMFGAGIIPMVYVFITTGFMGYVWGYTFAKTRSIMMPLGFHLGWNLLSACFYPWQPYGQLIFTGIRDSGFSELNSTLFSIFSGLFPPVITLLFVKWLVKRSFMGAKDNG